MSTDIDLTKDEADIPLADVLRHAHQYIFCMEHKSDPEHKRAQAICSLLTKAIYGLPSEPKTGLSSEEHQMIARLCDTSHEAVAAYERRFQIRGSLFGPIDNEMIELRDASARMIVAAINGGRKPPETNGERP